MTDNEFTARTWRIPVAVLAASASTIVTWILCFTVAELGSSVQVVIAAASVGTVAGCSVLAAIVIVSFRNTTKRSQDIAFRKNAKKLVELAEEVDASLGALRSDMNRQFDKLRAVQYALSSDVAQQAGDLAAVRDLHPKAN